MDVGVVTPPLAENVPKVFIRFELGLGLRVLGSSAKS